MTERRWRRVIRCVLDQRRAVAKCDECGWGQRYTGPAVTNAFCAARQHVDSTGHVAGVEEIHRTTYERCQPEIPDSGWSAWGEA